MQRYTTLAFLFGLTVILSSQRAHAQDAPMAPPPPAADATLDAQVGTWQGSGTMMGMQMTETVTTDWALGHQFLVSHATASMILPDGSQVTVESQMVIKPNGDGTYAGIYMDSWGLMGEFTGRLDESGHFSMEWTDPSEGDTHRSVETSSAEGTRNIQFLTQQPDGSWAESGGMTYTRAQ
jgi:hypothetical protein